MTVAQMIVSDIVPLRERGKYQGILVHFLKSVPEDKLTHFKGSVVALAHGVGPIIGGALASQGHGSW